MLNFRFSRAMMGSSLNESDMRWERSFFCYIGTVEPIRFRCSPVTSKDVYFRLE